MKPNRYVMFKLNNTSVDKVAKLCLDTYEKLPKTGKPTLEEWTVLSCVVLCDVENDRTEVVSLGTGTKCIGATKMSSSGDLLNDSHAEVIARRAFLLYLYDNIDRVHKNERSIFLKENGKFKLSDKIKFLFYSSQLPCGDASIMPKTDDSESFGEVVQSNKREAEYNLDEKCGKKSRAEVEDIHRTGAKCLPQAIQDTKQPGVSYHLLGQVRTKPGRGDKTLSVSCSDKIARWIHIGIQGSLLNMLLTKPIYIHHFIFGAKVPFSTESLIRAFLNRTEFVSLDVIPEFHQSTLEFECRKKEMNTRPAPSSIIWINDTTKLLEVAVQGRKLGITKKKIKCPKSYLSITKYNLLKKFIEIISKCEELRQCINVGDDIKAIPYNVMKKKCTEYMEKWDIVKVNFFKIWTKKPDMWNFTVDVN